MEACPAPLWAVFRNGGTDLKNGFQDTGGKESGWRALCGGPAWGTTPLSSPFVTKPPNTGLRPATQREGGEDRASAGAAEAAGSGGPTAEW